MVQSSPLMFQRFFFNSLVSTYPSFHILSVYSVVSRNRKVDNFANSLFFVDYYKVWPRLGDPCVCQSPIEVYACHCLGHMLGCAYTICSYGQIIIVIIIIKFSVIFCLFYAFMFLLPLLGDLFQSHWKIPPKEMIGSARCILLYFILAM